jgi:hypothetical protein
VQSSWTSNETARRGSSTPNEDDLTKKKKKKETHQTKTNKHEYLFFVLHFETSKIRLAETIHSVVAAHSESQATQRYSHNIFSLLFRRPTHLQHLQRKTIASKSSNGVSKNFHAHLKTHGLSAKEYKAWQTKNQLGRAQPSSAAGLGGDFGGGDFGGGFRRPGRPRRPRRALQGRS